MRLSRILALALLFVCSTLASAQSVDVPVGQRLVLTVEGRGVQIYRCDVKAEVAAWAFVAPEAGLFVRWAKIGTHGAGPVWRHKDGSTVHGKLVQSQASPETGAIPWLLLEASESGGDGVFTPVTYIRRTNTKGGQADPSTCDKEHAGTVARVPYTATYSFYTGTADTR